MARFRFHIAGGSPPMCIEADAQHLGELGDQLGRQRFITGRLYGEGDQQIDPPIDVLVPLHRVVLVAHEPEFADGAAPTWEGRHGR